MGPLTEGLSVPNDLDLSDRPAALEQLGVDTVANSRLVTITKDSERDTALLVATRAWPCSRPAWPTSPEAPKSSRACATG
ncbi:hypothetical protein ACFY04_28840 [Streptomyces sp. NPDC001549]|uniref:hypothetical protein n=1 Tax=Streptomyces sp. NPDC001549 TaxID=3364586 RepID=UPI0036BCE10D